MSGFSEYALCELCPRRCGADRLSGRRGRCGETAALRVGRAALHFYEEPCISGEGGSGAVFFSGCALSCVFCQNASLSRGGAGVATDERALADAFLALQEQGAHNINLVTGAQFAPHIVAALSDARARGLTVSAVWNTSGYESAETLRLLAGYIDIYLPDMKYISPALAKRYSGAEDYPAVARRALAEMFAQTGRFAIDGDGLMRRGMIVRHLALPGCAEDSKRVIAYLYEAFGDDVMLSIMRQYTPQNGVFEDELSRPLTDAEYDEIVDFAAELGVTNAFVQEGGSVSESFIPAFDGTGIAARGHK